MAIEFIYHMLKRSHRSIVFSYFNDHPYKYTTLNYTQEEC